MLFPGCTTVSQPSRHGELDSCHAAIAAAVTLTQALVENHDAFIIVPFIKLILRIAHGTPPGEKTKSARATSSDAQRRRCFASAHTWRRLYTGQYRRACASAQAQSSPLKAWNQPRPSILR